MKHTAKRASLPSVLLAYSISLLPLAAGLSLWTIAAFPSLGLHAVGYTAALFAAALCFALAGRSRLGSILTIAVAAACLIAVVVRHSSFLVLFNDFFTALQKVTGHISLPTDEVGSALWVVRGCMLLGGAILLGRAVCSGTPLWLIGILPSVLEGAFSGVVPLGLGACLLAVGILLLPRHTSTNRRVLLPRLAVVLVCALTATGVGFALRSVPQDGMRTAIGNLYHHVRYSHSASAMPEGKLSAMGPFETDDTPALKVTMETPRALYLRGSLYEEYTGSDWKSVSASTRADHAELFAWLHNNGFYGQVQVGLASARYGGGKPSPITIETLGACGSHGYLPYGAEDTAQLDETLIGDAKIPNADGTYLCYTDDLSTLYSLSRLAAQSTDKSFDDMENAYAEYVRHVDLKIPQDALDALYPLLGAPDKVQKLSDIESAVRDALGKALTYDTSAAVPKGKGDFVAQTLQSGRGYSVHYATTAVMMLRYFGVPARYAEGYYLPQEDAQRETVLTKKNAHAWAELYLNDVGFVPFEVTPGYSTDNTQEPESDQKASRGSASGSQSNRTDPSPPPPPPTSEVTTVNTAARNLSWLLWMLIPIAAALYVLIGRLRLRRALKRITLADNCQAVRMLYAYGEKLRRICPVKTHRAAPAEKLYLEARYSDHSITDKQRGHMLHYVHSLERRCKKHIPFFKKIYYRWVRFYF